MPHLFDRTNIIMKTITKALLALVFVAIAGTSVAKADSYRNSHYSYGHNGYWDESNHHRYHHWERYHDHDGYWDNQGGTRIFIDI
jgi:hypothetical protein